MSKYDDELAGFVRDSLSRGAARADIETALAAAGWPKEYIRTALANFAEVEFVVPVPRPRPHLSAQEAFFYLMLFSTLYVSAYSLGTLIFEFIERAFPDPTDKTHWAGYSFQEVRWSIARLVVAVPVFLYVSHRIHRRLVLDPTKRASGARKWLTYIALFIAASVVIADVVALIHGFLGGELTMRFVLKVLTVGVIGGAIFGYYLWDLRRDERNT